MFLTNTCWIFKLPLNVFVMTFQFHPGKNVGLGKDHTIFSLIDGLVKFEKFGPDRKKVSLLLSQWYRGEEKRVKYWWFSSDWQVSVYPRVVQPENPNSCRARKREYFRMQRERKKARKEGIALEPQLVLASASEATDGNPICWFLLWYPFIRNARFSVQISFYFCALFFQKSSVF